jgi:hypothetical protein
MTQTDTDQTADAAAQADGPEPQIIESRVVGDPLPVAQALEPHERQNPDGLNLIDGTDLTVVPLPNEIEAIAQLAVTVAGSKTAPRALQGNVNDSFMVLLTSRDLRISLTTGLRELHVIDGKVTISPKLKDALVKNQGHGRVFPHQAPRPDPADPEREILCPCGSRAGSNDTESATWHAIRHDDPTILHTSTFTSEDAARPEGKNALLGKDNWKNYPQRMLSARARGYLVDDVFPEVGTGLYSPDEIGAVTDEDGVPVIDVVGHAAPIAGTSAPRGHNAPPPPPEPPASAEIIAEIKARTDALKTVPEGRKVLVDLWTKPRSDDDPTPNLPRYDQLMAKHVNKAHALLDMIEKRARAGEWGPWDEQPAGASAPDAPSEPDPADGADATETAAAQGDDESAADPAPTASPAKTDDEVLVQTVIAEVKSLEPEKVDEQLAQRELDTDGRLDTRRHRLATAMIDERRAASA